MSDPKPRVADLANLRCAQANWRQKPLPGVNAQVPTGCTGLAITPKMNRELRRLLGTLNNPKAVQAMAPYAESAEEVVDAIINEIAARGFPVGPTVVEKIQTGGLMRMWGRRLFDMAAAQDDPRLADLATRIATAADQNFDRAHELHQRLTAEQRRAIPCDPLAAFGEPPVQEPEPANELAPVQESNK